MSKASPELYMVAVNTFARRQLDGLAVACFDFAGHGFAPHFHDEFVLGVNVIGREHIRLDKKTLEAGPQEITLYNPGQVQSSHPISGNWAFLSLYVEPRVLEDAFDLSPDTVFNQPVLAHDRMSSSMQTAISHALGSDVPEKEASEGLLQILDHLLLLAGSRPAHSSRHVPTSLQRIADRLLADLTLPTLSDLAAEADLTPIQLVRAFTQSYGLPPFSWAMNRRVDMARARLQQGQAIADVAADLGFADQAHLTRRFRAVYGVPPGRWRRG